MEVTELTTLADYFVICTGSSNTQINALCDAVEEKLEAEAGEKPLHREGHRGGIWVLLDYGCLVVHVFNTEAREFYGLERLWSDGKPLDVAALLAEEEKLSLPPLQAKRKTHAHHIGAKVFAVPP